jgi:acyl carrier protein
MNNVIADPRSQIILDIVAKETGVDRAALVPDATVEQLGIASLDLTQALFEIETKFDVEIPVLPTTAGQEFISIGALLAHVLATLDQQAA